MADVEETWLLLTGHDSLSAKLRQMFGLLGSFRLAYLLLLHLLHELKSCDLLAKDFLACLHTLQSRHEKVVDVARIGIDHDIWQNLMICASNYCRCGFFVEFHPGDRLDCWDCCFDLHLGVSDCFSFLNLNRLFGNFSRHFSIASDLHFYHEDLFNVQCCFFRGLLRCVSDHSIAESLDRIKTRHFLSPLARVPCFVVCALSPPFSSSDWLNWHLCREQRQSDPPKPPAEYFCDATAWLVSARCAAKNRHGPTDRQSCCPKSKGCPFSQQPPQKQLLVQKPAHQRNRFRPCTLFKEYWKRQIGPYPTREANFCP